MDIKRLQELRESPYVKIITDYFYEQIDKMSDVSTHRTWDEVLGKQYAVKILKDLIRLLETKPDKSKLPNQYK